VRVRTYCFPGCLTRPPGTSTRNHPCEPTTSKPVVPRSYVPPILAALGPRSRVPSLHSRVADAGAAAAPSSIDAAREDFRRSMTRAPRPPMASVRDLEVPGGDAPVRARLLVPADAGDDALVYIHGGGWHLGGLDDWEPVARVIAQATGCPLLGIEHRQAPEHPFPRRSTTCARRCAGPSRTRQPSAHGESASPATARARTSRRPPRATSAASRSRCSSTPPSISRAIPSPSRTPTGSPSHGRWRRRASATSGPPIRAIPTSRLCSRPTLPACPRPGTFARRPAEAIAQFGAAVRSMLAR
jgi:hypothetical protein